MKKLTKIKLVNWMYFVDSTIEISGNTLITGVNASGKSTIVDALQFLFMGGIRGVKFNSAANEQGKRTLDGYLRGKISTEGQEYLRSTNCIGHIAVEITDEQGDSSIIGVVLDIQSNNPQVKTVFYKIDNTKLVDDYFIKDSYPNSFKELEKFAKLRSKPFVRFGTTEQYRMMLKTYLGIDSQKYAKLMPSAIGVGSVTKMDDFINQFLLEEDLVEVNDLQDNIQNMKRLIEKINLDERKLRELEVILEKGKIIAGRKEKLRVIEIARLIAVYRDYDNAIKRFEKDIEDARKDRKTKNELLSQKQTEEQSQNAIVMELQKSLDQNDENKALVALDKRLKEIEIALERENERFAEAKEGLKKIKSCVDRLSVEGYQELSNASSELDASKGSTALLALIKDLYTRFSELKLTLSGRQHVLHEELQENIAKTKANNEKLENLRKNIKAYPDYVVALITNINRRLSERHGKKIEVKPLCEYVDSVDETWRNAIEGYLNTQRFDIICEQPNLFDECLEIYEEIKFKLGIYGIGIVNTSKYHNDIEPTAGTLADKITFYNKFARNYAFSILNRVVCVSKLHDLKQHENSITATCMRYANHVARQIPPQIYSTPFLGLEANKIYIKKLESENVELGELHAKISDGLYATTRCIDSIGQSGIEWLSNNEHCLMSIDNRQALLKDKAKEEKAKAELEKNPTYFSLSEKLEKEKKKYGVIRDDVTGIKAKIEAIVKLIENANLGIDSKMDGRADSEAKLNAAQRSDRALMPEAEKRYEESSSGKKDLQSIITSLDNASYNYLTTKIELELTGIMTQYCMTFNFSAGKNFDALELYQQERNIIADTNLIKYKGDLEDITTKINKIFQEHFIVEIRRRIKNCYEQIDVLNKQLREKHFGDDQYKMECKPTQDTELRRYYSLIMDENYDNIGTLFSDAATEKYAQDFSRMIEEITTAAARGEQNNRLLDYRKYLNFDIIITGKNGTRRFSDLKHIQSGGEGQVPFYIIAAVSFQNLLTKSRTRSNLCVVLFDEAFNNMDPQRIKTMMEFYSSLNLQIFLSLTGEKIGNIMKYMDTTVMVIREGKNVQVKELWGKYNDN